MKKSVCFVVLFCSLCVHGRVFAETKKYFLITGFSSQYLVKPQGTILYNRPIWENTFMISFDPWYFGTWIAKGVNDKGIDSKENLGNEFDFFLGLRKTFGLVEADLSASYYVLNRFRESKDDFWILDYRLNFNLPFATPYIASRYFGKVGENSPGRGWFHTIGGHRNQLIKEFTIGGYTRSLYVDFDASLGLSSGALEGKSGLVWSRFGATATLEINKNISLSHSLSIQIPNRDGKGYVDEEELVGGVFLNLSF